MGIISNKILGEKDSEFIRKLDGANMDIDLASDEKDISWKQDQCPWNKFENTNEHKCAVKNISILLGSHRQEETGYFNTIYYLHEGRIIFYYDKKNLTPITEQNNFNNPLLTFIAQLSWPQNKKFESGKKDPEIFHMEQFSCFPQICSDLFLGMHDKLFKMAQRYHIPVVCIANDLWFPLRYAKQLMMAYAQFNAIIHNVEFIYVDNNHGYYLHK